MAHGVAGLAGVGALLLGLHGPARGVTTGAGSFGRVAAGLLAVAALVGLSLFAVRLWRWPPSSILLGLHATFAIAGVVMLAAWLTA